MQRQVIPQLSPKKGQAIWSRILNEAKADGLMEPTTFRTGARLFALTFLFAIALYGSWIVQGPIEFILLLISLSLLMSQFAFIGHDAGHGTISRRNLVNQGFGQFAMTLIAGMCFDAWFKTHRTHHQFCQNEAKDPDMAVSLVVSLTERSSHSKKPLGQFFTRFQHILIWFFSLFFAHSQRHLTQVDALRWRCRSDGFFTILHLMIWIAIPYWILDVSGARIALVYFVPAFILGPHLASIFWINHIGMPTVERQDAFSFLEHQAVTSRTVSIPFGLRWLFGGLDLQVEHHILCQVPSFKLRRLQPIVEAHLKKGGLEYRTYSWWQAVISIQRHLKSIATSRP